MNTSNRIFKSLIPSIIALILLTSCQREIQDNITLYSASDSYSAFTSNALAQLSTSEYKPQDSLPDIFAVKGTDIEHLTDEQYVLMLKTCFEGNTLIIDRPSQESLTALGLAVSIVTVNEQSLAQYKDQRDSIYILINQTGLFDVPDGQEIPSELSVEPGYEAIAVNKKQLYCVHTLSKNATERFISNTAASFISSLVTAPSTGSRSSFMAKDVNTPEVYYDYFSAEFYDDYDELHEELFESELNVWAVKDKATKTNYFLVNSKLTCHNDDLGYENVWQENKKRTGPYLGKLTYFQDIAYSYYDSIIIKGINPTKENPMGTDSPMTIPVENYNISQIRLPQNNPLNFDISTNGACYTAAYTSPNTPFSDTGTDEPPSVTHTKTENSFQVLYAIPNNGYGRIDCTINYLIFDMIFESKSVPNDPDSSAQIERNKYARNYYAYYSRLPSLPANVME